MKIKKSNIFFGYAFALFCTLCCFSKKDIFNPKLYTCDVEYKEREYFLKYLGMSYDIIKGNPWGDPIYGIDLGYRRNVLKIRKVNSDNNIKDDIVKFKVGEASKIKCIDNIKENVIDNLCDINKEYEKSYSVSSINDDIHPFNDSNYYKMLVKRINRGDSIIIEKKLCSKYFSSINDINKNDLDTFFLTTLNELGDNYQNIKDDTYKCSLQYYKMNNMNKYSENCLKTITPWISFFNMYGTHMISGVYYGGKIIHNLYFENNNLKKKDYKIRIYKRRLNPFGTINSNLYFGSSLSREKIIYIRERNLIMDGGVQINPYNINEINMEKKKKNIYVNNVEKNLYDQNKKYRNYYNFYELKDNVIDVGKRNYYNSWKDTIEWEQAKPVKLNLVPLSEFINSEEGKSAYYMALEFYSNLSYSNYNPYLYVLNKSEKDIYIMDIKRNWEQYIDKNININVTPKCKNGDKILSGFILTNKKKSYEDNHIMHMCPSNTVCSSGINIESDKNFEFSWILCSKENRSEIHQILTKNTIQGNGKASCPSNMKIGFGFSLTFQKSINTNIKIEPCESNKRECKRTNLGSSSQTYFWINCLPTNKNILLQTLESKTYSEKKYLNDHFVFSLKCSEGKYIIAGFAIDYIPSGVNDYLVCPVGSNKCDLKIHVMEKNIGEVHIPIMYIVCSSIA
ncbi:perforin-like protein 5 [Plasmodium reichenowi]|uniref:Perforin-like protein 5 n=1 Tax=Plasmodium reichenowi TaxID=5854 RepID=A0A2P9DBW4_PLARE|nr:perforin-like protein 5 [Plasmodium reichenowi]